MRFRFWTILWVFALFTSGIVFHPILGSVATILTVAFWFHVFEQSTPTFVETLILSAVTGTLLGLLIPPTCTTFSVERGEMCIRSLREAAQSIWLYYRQHGTLPAASVSGPDGNAWHSWRLFVCPNLEDLSLFNQYTVTEPWDGPTNSQLVSHDQPLFTRCRMLNDRSSTNYLAVVDKCTAWLPDRGRKLSAFKDGSEQTILLLKAATKSVPWAKPEDLSYNEAMELLTISSKQREGTHHWRSYGLFEKPSRVVNAVFVDGSIRQLNVPIKPELARALLTIAGGETIDQGELEKISQPQLNCTKIYALSVFVLLSLLPLYKFITRKHELAAI